MNNRAKISLFDLTINQQLNLLIKNEKYILKLAKCVSFEIFYTIIKRYIYYVHVKPKTYNLKYKQQSNNYDLRLNLPYVRFNYYLLNLITNKIINLGDHYYSNDIYHNNRNILVNSYELTKDKNIFLSLVHTVDPSKCQMTNIYNKAKHLLLNIYERNYEIIYNISKSPKIIKKIIDDYDQHPRKSKYIDYYLIEGRVTKYFDNGYLLSLSDNNTTSKSTHTLFVYQYVNKQWTKIKSFDYDIGTNLLSIRSFNDLLDLIDKYNSNLIDFMFKIIQMDIFCYEHQILYNVDYECLIINLSNHELFLCDIKNSDIIPINYKHDRIVCITSLEKGFIAYCNKHEIYRYTIIYEGNKKLTTIPELLSDPYCDHPFVESKYYIKRKDDDKYITGGTNMIYNKNYQPLYFTTNNKLHLVNQNLYLIAPFQSFESNYSTIFTNDVFNNKIPNIKLAKYNSKNLNQITKIHTERILKYKDDDWKHRLKYYSKNNLEYLYNSIIIKFDQPCLIDTLNNNVIPIYNIKNKCMPLLGRGPSKFYIGNIIYRFHVLECGFLIVHRKS